MFQTHVQRWETHTRWYEISIVHDLLDDWTIVRRWGGLQSQHNGCLIEVVDSYDSACQRLDILAQERRRRPTPYHPV